MPQTIAEYLEQVRAAGATPTFTNIGGDNPMLEPGPVPPPERPGMQQAPGAHLIQEAGGNPTMSGGQVTPAPSPEPAIPERETEEDLMSTSPVVLANRAADKMQPEIYKRLGIAPGSPLTKAQREMVKKATTSMRNGLTDHYDWQQKQAAKGKEEEAKKMQDQTLTVKDKASMYNDFRKDYAEMANDPMTRNNMDPNETADQYAQRMLSETVAAVSGAGEEGAMPTRDQQDPMGDVNMMGGYQGAMPGQQRMPDRNEFQKAANALFAKYGRDEEGKKLVFAELEKQFPGIFEQRGPSMMGAPGMQ